MRTAAGTTPARSSNRPVDGLARRDPRPLVSHLDPAAPLDDDEPRRVRVRVRLDPRAGAERELGYPPAAVAVDHLAGDADRAGWALRAPVARPEATDLDRHRLPPVAQRRRRLRAVLGRMVDSGRENRCRLK